MEEDVLLLHNLPEVRQILRQKLHRPAGPGVDMFGDSATAITIIFIICAAGVAAFVRKRSRDKCLRDFEHNIVTLEDASGKTVWGASKERE